MDSVGYSRTDWPVEQDVNFTDIMPSGTFDLNSTKLIEYSQAGNILYEVPVQFDEDEGFDAASNATGTLIFMLNGTTGADTNRTFYLYYDASENGAKEQVTYPTNLSYSTNGNLISVNNSFLRLYLDTNRLDNTSGLYRVEDKYENVVFDATSSERTAEYMEYFNGTQNTSFDLIGSADFVNGSRLQVGESFG